MENPSTWTLLHHDLHRASSRTFSSLEQKAEALMVVLENHRIFATQEEMIEVINNFATRLENGICGSSLPDTIVKTFQGDSK